MDNSSIGPDTIRGVAERALQRMREAGFEHAQVGVSVALQEELNIAFNEPGLWRSTERHKLSLLGLVDGRKAATEMTALDDTAVQARIAGLFTDARSAPQDDANAVSAGQHARIAQGPQAGDAALLADSVAELLAFRARETPRFMLQEGTAAHTRVHSQLLTSGGSDLAASIGHYTLSAVGTAREGPHASSFCFTGGDCHALQARQATELFGIAAMLREAEQQIHAHPIPAKFDGDVVLTPHAVDDLVRWLLGQLTDVALISGSSLYLGRAGSPVASPLLQLRSRFDAPGVAAISADAFATPPVEILRAGRLTTLTPSLYGSRKTGLPHVPLAAQGGWELAAGATPLADLIAGVRQGALVGRLSMGMPAANGNFSGVIKNSFSLEGGRIGPALSETMISGNVARMLHDVAAVSAERIDGGALWAPWLHIVGLHFS